MQLRTKVILYIFAIFLGMGIVVFLGSHQILKNSYLKVENSVAKAHTQHAQKFIEQILDSVSTIVKSGAVWDDLYRAMLDKNKRHDVIQSAFSVDSLRSNDQDISLLYDAKAHLIDATALDDARQHKVPIPDGLSSYLQPSSQLYPLNIHQEVKGLIYLPCKRKVSLTVLSEKNHTLSSSRTSDCLPYWKSILLLAAYPVLPASTSGSAQGTLIQGKFFSKNLPLQIKNNARLNIRIYTPYEILPDKNLIFIYNILLHKKNNFYYLNKKSDLFFVYSLLKDINQQPFGMLRIEIPRVIFSMGMKTINDFDYLFWSFMIFSSIVLFFLLTFLVIRRLETMNIQLSKIGEEDDASIRLKEHGSDEIASLSFEINKMLDIIHEYNLQKENLLNQIYAELEEISQVSGKLKKVENFLEEIIDSMPSIVVITNHEMTISHLNALAEESIAMTLKEVKGKNLFEIFPYLQPYSQKFLRSIQEKKIQSVNQLSRRLHDVLHFYNIIIYPFSLKDQIYLVVRIDDITDIIKLEESVLQNDKLASIGVLTAGISYEISQPINLIAEMIPSLQLKINQLIQILEKYLAIKSYQDRNQMMNFSDILEKINNLLTKINELAKKTVGIVQDLKNFSRIDESIMKKADVLENIASILALLRHTYQGRIQIIQEYDQDIPKIDCYPGKLNQVFMNLITNAIDAIPDKGEIKIVAKKLEKNIKICIKDTGVGMSGEILSKIFEPFFSTKEGKKGIGLGLDACRDIIMAHGGNIEIISQKNAGTEAIVILPIEGSFNE